MKTLKTPKSIRHPQSSLLVITEDADYNLSLAHQAMRSLVQLMNGAADLAHKAKTGHKTNGSIELCPEKLGALLTLISNQMNYEVATLRQVEMIRQEAHHAKA